MSFPSNEEFTQRVQSQAQQPALKWRELTIGEIYRIDVVKTITTRFGPGTVLELTTRDDNKIEAWAPARLAKDLGWDDLPRYIRPLGKFHCTKDSTKSYHKYELLPKP